MSAPTISPSLSASCLSAMGAPYTSMATSCGQPSGPSITNLASNTAQLLGSACSTACSTAIAEFAKAGNATCADQKVFVGDAGATAHDLISQFSLISAVGCVKGTDGSYCAVGQINTLTAAGLSSNSANLLTNLVTYAQKNTTFACSSCAKNEIAAAQALTTLDSAWVANVQGVVLGQATICASQTPNPPKNGALGLYVGSVLAFLPLLTL